MLHPPNANPGPSNGKLGALAMAIGCQELDVLLSV
jgi:hypothetical protein